MTATARRLAQQGQVAARLRSASLAALEEWFDQVRDRVLADTNPIPDTTFPLGLAQAWAASVAHHVGHELGAGVDSTVAAELLGTGLSVTEGSAWAEQYVAGLANRWAGVPSYAAGVLAHALAGALADGSDPRKTMVFALDDAMGPLTERISRTEATAAVNGALLVAWGRRDAATGSVTHKRWVAVESGARDSHAAASGQTVPLDARFLLEGEELAHPGDPTASASAISYCRCLLEDVVVQAGGEAALTAAATNRAAVLAAEGNETMTKARTWSGLLAPFGVNSGDRRRLAKGGEFGHRDLPLPLMFQEATSGGHANSVVVGRILSIDVKDDGYHASGDYLIGEEFENDVARAIALADAGLGHVSVDLADVTGEMSDADGNPITEEAYIEAWLTGQPLEVYDQFTKATLLGVTQVAKPAFAEAMINLDVVEEGAAAEASVEAAQAEAADESPEVPEGELAAPGTGGEQEAGEEASTDAAEEVVAAAEEIVETAAEQIESLRAAAGNVVEWAPDAEVFANPQLSALTPLTIGPADEDGYRRVFGHVAGWQTCHIAYANTCVTPPKEDSFDYFHVGEVVCADGSALPVGNLTLGGRHANEQSAYRDAIEHYDDSGSGVATVRAYADEHGIAVAGVITPETTEAQINQMRRSVLSGDWRRIGGRMRLVGALAVNTGGFPVPRYAFDGRGRQMSLVAAGAVPQGLKVEESYEDVARRVFAEERQREARRLEVAELMSGVFADELAELLAEVDV